MNRTQHKVFMSRTRNSYNSHKERAQEKKQELDYTLDHLRQQIAWHVGKPCRYCKDILTVRTFSIDHKTPIATGGEFNWHNIEVICTKCNQRKGRLSAEQYTSFLEHLTQYPEPITRDVLSRMRAGAHRIWAKK